MSNQPVWKVIVERGDGELQEYQLACDSRRHAENLAIGDRKPTTKWSDGSKIISSARIK